MAWSYLTKVIDRPSTGENASTSKPRERHEDKAIGVADPALTDSTWDLFFIQGADNSALVDPLDEGWIDDQIRVGLFCLRVMGGNHIERAGNHLHGRRWH